MLDQTILPELKCSCCMFTHHGVVRRWQLTHSFSCINLISHIHQSTGGTIWNLFFKLWCDIPRVDETKLEDSVNLKVQKPKFESVISYSYSQGSRWSHQERRNMELNQINQTQIRGKTDQIEPNQAVKTQLDLHSTANPRGKNVNNANNSNWSKKATKPIQTKPKPTKSKPKEKKTRSTILANPVKPWKIIQKSSAKISTL